jgi:gas vesicle protein
VCAGAAIGALVGAAAAYLFFTDRGRVLRDRIEAAIDDARREFLRFQKTIEKLGVLANDGIQMMNDFNLARAASPFSADTTSH